MKMHRCPHCGEKSFSNSRWLSMKYYRPYRFGKINGGFSRTYRVLYKCAVCGGRGRFRYVKDKMSTIETVAFIAIVVSAGISGVLLSGVYRAAALLIGGTLALAWLILFRSFTAYCPAEYTKSGFIEWLNFNPTTRVEVNMAKYIKPYTVYGLKFKDETKSDKLKEAFPDGLVPAEFKPNKKGSLEYDIRIINRAGVPDDILYDGAKFLVEDSDGIFIAKGTVTKSKLEI